MEKSLQIKIQELTTEIEKTKQYSSSKIYNLYNEVFNVKDKYSGCPSCLKRRLRTLQQWLKNNPLPIEQPELISNEIEISDSGEVNEETEIDKPTKKQKKK